ncbi:MAG: hypothetical protein VYA34_12405 [Myxococcota bacterium]|nr:hypothetical protein [Myxococcota bacterium]
MSEISLNQFLHGLKDHELSTCILSLAKACRKVSRAIHNEIPNLSQVATTTNEFGDQQLGIDLFADQVLADGLRASGVVATGSSEEIPEEVAMGGKNLSVAWDPLDGSSVIGQNFSVGTIFGVWRSPTLLGVSGKDMVASGCAIYGPRTTLSIAVEGYPNSLAFRLKPDNTWVKTEDFQSIGSGKLFAPGNLRATEDNPGYKKLVEIWMREQYQLRYTGALVPDVNMLLVKGKGIFCNAGSPKAKAKLRLLYEVMPLAYLIEKAGGASSDGEKSIMEYKADSLNQTVQVCLGNAEEVARFNKIVGTQYLS